MSSHRVICGFCLLCALAFGAIADQAAAASKGTTGFTCKKVTPAVGTAGFSKAHCTPADAVSTNANYEHVAIAANTTTKGKTTNTTTEGIRQPFILASVQSGVEEELRAGTVEGEGWGENVVDPVTGEHFGRGEGSTVYKEVEMTKPAGKGCRVFESEGGAEGVVKTQLLKGTTLGQGDAGKVEPASGSTFAIFFISGCSVAALNGKYEVTGSLRGEVNGATTSFTVAGIKAQGTLKLRGQNAGIGGTTTAVAKDEAAGDVEYTPVSATTVETP